MKKLILLFIVLISISNLAFSQKKSMYSTTSGEWIFSFASIKEGGVDASSILRFSPFFNFQQNVHYDMSQKVGLYSGLDVKNVGFIYDVPNSNIRKKYRTYNLGIPIAFKVGNMDKTFLYGGYEVEFAFNYKEKTFTNEKKTDKYSVWFSKQTNTVNNTLFVGIQLPHGANIRFRYYLTNFFNKSYTAQDANGNPYQPYQDTNVHMFYFSLNFYILRNGTIYYMDKKDK